MMVFRVIGTEDQNFKEVIWYFRRIFKQDKTKQFCFSIGVDLLKNSFSIKNKYFKDIRNESLKILNKNEFAKNIFINIADKGLKF